MRSNTKYNIIEAAQWTWVISIAFQIICAVFYFSELKLDTLAQYVLTGSAIILILVFINIVAFNFFREYA